MVAQSAAAPSAAAQGSQRDAAVEDEILHCGYFADVVFKFRSRDTQDVEEVYGQRALFALLSPSLRHQLLPPPAAAEGGRSEVWLDGGITARGFREVARYVYRLQPCFSMPALAEVLAAARATQMQELEASAVQWGLATLGELAEAGGVSEDSSQARPSESRAGTPLGNDRVEDALWCLEHLTTFEPPSTEAEAWCTALVSAFRAEQILLSPAFFELSPSALHLLLEEDAVCNDPSRLWLSVLHWGFARAPAAVAAAGLQQKECDRRGMPKLFGKGTRFAESLAPAPPSEDIVGWQRQLLPFVGRIRFAQMAPLEFAKNVESVDPILPELRQAIYAVRRQGAGSAAGDLPGGAGAAAPQAGKSPGPTETDAPRGENLTHFAQRVRFSIG